MEASVIPVGSSRREIGFLAGTFLIGLATLEIALSAAGSLRRPIKPIEATTGSPKKIVPFQTRREHPSTAWIRHEA